MSQLTLANPLTYSVSREVNAANRKADMLSKSMTTGVNQNVQVMDSFLGNSLRDSEIVLGAVAQKTAYSINMLTITDEYLKTVALSLQEAQKTVGSAGAISQDKLTVLQKNLDDKKAQVDLMIRTADFDGKSLLSGGAKKVDVQVGLSIADKFSVRVADISDGKLMRIGASESLNEYIGGKLGRIGGDKFDTQEKLDAAVTSRTNFTQEAAADLTPQNLADAITAVRDGNTSFIRIADEKLVPILNSKIVEQANSKISNSSEVNSVVNKSFTNIFKSAYPIHLFPNNPEMIAAVAAAEEEVNKAIALGKEYDIFVIGNSIQIAVDAVPGLPAGTGANIQQEFLNAMLSTDAVDATPVSNSGGALVAADADTLGATIQSNYLIRWDAAGAIANATDAAIAANLGADANTVAAAIKAGVATAAVDTVISYMQFYISNGSVTTSAVNAHDVALRILNDATNMPLGTWIGNAGSAARVLLNDALNSVVVNASTSGFSQVGVSNTAMRNAINASLNVDVRLDANVITQSNILGDIAAELYKASLKSNVILEHSNLPGANNIASEFDAIFQNIVPISGDAAEETIVDAIRTAISDGIAASDTIVTIGNAIDLAADKVAGAPAGAGANAQTAFLNAMQATNAVVATPVSANGGALVASPKGSLSATIQTNAVIRLDAAGSISEAVNLAIAQNPGAVNASR